MTTVYAVVDGTPYEGGYVYGIFSTKEKALDYASANPERWMDMAEWALDDVSSERDTVALYEQGEWVYK